MDISVGISHPHELPILSRAGADRLFFACGFPVHLHRRPAAGRFALESFPEVVELAMLANRHHIDIEALLNLRMIDDRSLEEATVCAGMLRSIGIERFVVSNIGLLKTLREMIPSAYIALGIGGMCSNSHSYRMLAAAGANEVVVEREMRPSAIKAMIDVGATVSSIVFYDRCSLLDSCCSLPGLLRVLAYNGKMESCQCACDFTTANIAKTFQRARSGHGCCLCNIPALIELGISVVKIAGRGKFIDEKRRLIEGLRVLVDEGTTAAHPQAVFRKATGRECSEHECYRWR